MANFSKICKWVMQQEDAGLTGKIVDMRDGQGSTRFGIAQKSHPEVDPWFFSTTMPAALALPIAEGVYRNTYWNRFQGDAIVDDGVASCLLSFAINDGTVREVQMLQECLNLPIDGIVGPVTLEHTNAFNSGVLAAALRAAQGDFYRAVVANNPERAPYLPAWLKRANRVYPSLA